MTDSLNAIELIMHASPVVKGVMAILLFASLIGWYIIFNLETRYHKQRKADQTFLQLFWSGADIKTLFQGLQAQTERQGLAAVFFDGFSEFIKLRQKGAEKEQIIAGTERMIRITLNREQHTLEDGASTLATIGSVSPYIGLLGTVWGIMSAFLGLSVAQQVTLSSVAPGIAEALIATAIGLIAAIPAVIAYNRYTSKFERVYEERSLFAEELMALLHRDVK